MAHDVFISYASEDKPVADAVCGTLEARGIRCWIAPRDVLAGIPYGEAILDAIHECRIMVLIFSSKANLSGHIPREIERAVSKGAIVMPFRIEDILPSKSLDYFIGNVHWLDALTPPLETHLHRLTENVQALLGLPGARVELRSRSAIVMPASVPLDPQDGSSPMPSSTTSASASKKQSGWLSPTLVALCTTVLLGILAVYWLRKSSTQPSQSTSIVNGAPWEPPHLLDSGAQERPGEKTNPSLEGAFGAISSQPDRSNVETTVTDSVTPDGAASEHAAIEDSRARVGLEESAPTGVAKEAQSEAVNQRKPEFVRVDPHISDRAEAISFSPDGSLIAVATNYNITVADVQTGHRLWTVPRVGARDAFEGSKESVAVSPDGHLVASVEKTKKLGKAIVIRDVQSGAVVRTLKPPPINTAAVAFSPSSCQIASAGLLGVMGWDVQSGSEILSLRGPSAETVAFSPGGRQVASGGRDETVKIWDVTTGAEVRTLLGHSKGVLAVAFSRDGRLLASGSDDETVKLWDVNTGGVVATLSGHTEAITSVAFSPEGRLLASASMDNTVRVWDVATGAEVCSLPGRKVEVQGISQRFVVTDVVFSPDGHLLAAAGDGLLLWRRAE